jgi:dTDP-4-amino-4,6-dideoxygalactose transaminase
MQPIYRDHAFVGTEDVGADLFRRGLCLPSDNKMTPQEQEIVIEIIHRCFR